MADDKSATVGTTNMDFRSLYLHFECGVWMAGSRTVLQIKQDFEKTLKDCQQIRLEDCQSRWYTHLLQDVLRLFAPLM